MIAHNVTISHPLLQFSLLLYYIPSSSRMVFFCMRLVAWSVMSNLVTASMFLSTCSFSTRTIVEIPTVTCNYSTPVTSSSRCRVRTSSTLLVVASTTAPSSSSSSTPSPSWGQRTRLSLAVNDGLQLLIFLFQLFVLLLKINIRGQVST